MKIIYKLGVGLMIASFAIFSANAQINLGGSVDADVKAGVEVDGGVQVETGAEAGTNVELETGSAGITVTSSAQVSSETDLEAFNEGVEARNSAVADVRTTSSEVEVVYRHSGRLFWIFPVTVKSTTSVEARANAEPEVRSRLAWWSFLVAGKNYDKAEIEANIRGNVRVAANAKVDASARAKARVAEAIIAELDAHAQAQTAVSN